MGISVSAVSEALLAACRRREEAAQFQLYQLLSHQLMGVCLRYCPSRAEAEDALQNTFVKLFSRLDQYRADGPFEAWAHRVAVHTSLHALEQHRRRHPGGYGPTDLDDLALDLPSLEPSALDGLAADLLYHLAERCAAWSRDDCRRHSIRRRTALLWHEAPHYQ
jgi:RNA polymerase sigma-70 factor (ECF subfamily)